LLAVAAHRTAQGDRPGTWGAERRGTGSTQTDDTADDATETTAAVSSRLLPLDGGLRHRRTGPVGRVHSTAQADRDGGRAERTEEGTKR
jgi:hypothetical protein